MKNGFRVTGVKKFVMQREVGETCGTPHIQFCIQFRSQKTVTWQPAFDKELGFDPEGPVGNKGLHWEACQSWKNSCTYCSKEDTAVASPVTNMPEYNRVAPMDIFDLSIATPWQKDILALAEADPEPRHIYWVWETTGGVGKTALARHLFIKYMHNVYPVMVCSGKANDIKYSVACMKKEHHKEPRMIIWDLPRTHTTPDWAGVEEVKNGLFCNTKYESGSVLLNVFPHIVIFSNHPPDVLKLSADRWKIVYAGTEPVPSHHPMFLT